MPSSRDQDPKPPIPTAEVTAGRTGREDGSMSPQRRSGRGVLDNNAKMMMKKYRTEIAASSAGLFSVLLTYPLDTIKTRMQSNHNVKFMDCARALYKDGSVIKNPGALSSIINATINRTISFSIYQEFKYTYDECFRRATGLSPLKHANTVGTWPTWWTAACFGSAGATTGAVITFIQCPFDLVKLIAQQPIDSKHPQLAKAKGTLATARAMIRNRGISSLYTGFRLHLMRDTMGNALFFGIYESTKQVLANARGNSPTSPSAVILAGGFCGVVSMTWSYPVDTVKTMYQKDVFKTDHPKKAAMTRIKFLERSHYSGLGVGVARTFLSGAIFFAIFEGVKKKINRLEILDEE